MVSCQLWSRQNVDLIRLYKVTNEISAPLVKYYFKVVQLTITRIIIWIKPIYIVILYMTPPHKKTTERHQINFTWTTENVLKKTRLLIAEFCTIQFKKNIKSITTWKQLLVMLSLTPCTVVALAYFAKATKLFLKIAKRHYVTTLLTNFNLDLLLLVLLYCS